MEQMITTVKRHIYSAIRVFLATFIATISLQITLTPQT